MSRLEVRDRFCVKKILYKVFTEISLLPAAVSAQKKYESSIIVGPSNYDTSLWTGLTTFQQRSRRTDYRVRLLIGRPLGY